ncbi:hypothetical protein IE81DRAFT_320438 [Ceraceosorus guamensis]|uniref:WW domain-containing protein n=1 Tax=Ceraceosorus guamensis TaxID=1522189 RepID=A0A316W5L2_9BASI|nr:hypothetical protein IE81DRAFT_320438 [Ceraceosorus guamensis]PWN45256.1 hypothetical protein IE81DRAFT_320438 [Ceraceosorus guamensis]
MSTDANADQASTSAPWFSPAQAQVAPTKATTRPSASDSAASPGHSAPVVTGVSEVTTSAASSTVPAIAESAKRGATAPGPLLDRAEVARDQNIFRPNGEIVFPRSDGDPEYGPPNTALPKPTDSEVNYYHSWGDIATAERDWGSKIGSFLAQEFGLPANPPQGKRWFVGRFPKHYEMTEQRKGLQVSPRTDPYLFGSKAHRFRSAVESHAHFILLLLDPTMDPRNCSCKYCKGKGTEPKTSASYMPKGPKATKAAAPRTSKGNDRKGATGKRRNVDAPKPNEAYIRTRRLVKRDHLPGVPIHSAPEREAELARGTPQRGQREGFRAGEMCWAALPEPVEAPNKDPTTRVTHLIVTIDRKDFDVTVAPDVGETPGSFDLTGRVSHAPVYLVKVLGTNELARVKEEDLIPLLAFNVAGELTQWLKVDPAEVPWLEDDLPPPLHLFPDPNAMPATTETRPNFVTIVSAFAHGLRIASLIRSTFTPTDSFKRDSWGLPAPTTHPIPNVPDASKERSGAQSGANQNGEGGSPAAGAGNAAPGGDVPPAPHQSGPEVDNNLYYQGILFGPERIWVGDTVRLNLSAAQVKKLLHDMGPNEKMPGVSSNVNVPLVMRIKAIFTPEKKKAKLSAAEVNAAAEEEERAAAQGIRDKSAAADDAGEEPVEYRIAGDLYQVLEEEEAKKLQLESHMAPTSTLGPVARSTYVIPVRPFLVELPSKLPPSGILPEGFTLQRVNQGSIEVECPLSQIAGRLWTSYAPSEPLPRKVLEQREVPLQAPSQEATDAYTVSLSLAGLLPGHLKMVAAETPKLDRDQAVRECEGTARMLLRAYIKNEWNLGRAADDGEEANSESNGEGNGSVEKRKRGRPSGRKSSTTDAEGARSSPKPAGHTSASGTPAAKKARKSAASDISGSPSTSTPIAKPRKKSAASAASALADREESPPLPPGWIKKVSRKGQGTYYANPELRKVSWERP